MLTTTGDRKIEVRLVEEEEQTPPPALEGPALALFTHMAVQKPQNSNPDPQEFKTELEVTMVELSKSKLSSPLSNVQVITSEETESTGHAELKIESSEPQTNETETENKDPAYPIIKEEGTGCSIGSSTPPASRRRFKPKELKVTVVSKIVRKFRCTICELPVNSIEELVHHLKITHKIKTQGQPAIVNAAERDENEEREKISMLIEAIDKNRRASSSDNSDSEDGPNSSNRQGLTSLGGKKKQSLKHRLKKNLRCKHCYADFRSVHWYRYDDHLKRHATGKMYNCSYCDMTFPFRFSLQRHLRGLELEAASTLTQPVLHKCSHCDSSFANRRCLLFHLTQHDGCHRCPICEMSFPFSYDLGTHTRERHSREAGRVTCTQCDIIFSSTKFHAKHMVNVHDRVSCPVCHGTFSNQLGCDLHMKRMHTKKPGEARPHRCKLCPQSFTGTAYLTRHYRKFHNKEPSYTTGKINRNLNRLSTAIRPYPCRLCKDKFTGQGYLTRHYRFVHRREPPKPMGTKDIPHPTTSTQFSSRSTSIETKVKPENSAPTRASRSSIKVRKNYNEETDSEAEDFEDQFIIPKTVKLEFKDVEEGEDELGKGPETGMTESIYSTPHICKLCSKSYSSNCNLKRHFRLTHPELVQNWPSQQRVKKIVHKKRVIEAPSSSEESESSEDDSKIYISPQKSQSGDEERRFPCPRCPWKFQNQWKLTRHMNGIRCSGRRLSQGGQEMPLSQEVRAIPLSQEVPAIPLSQEVQGIPLPETQVLKAPMKREDTNPRKIKAPRRKNASEVPRRANSGKRSYRPPKATCPYCRKQLQTDQSLRYHMVHFHEEKLDEGYQNLFICNYCKDKRNFKTWDGLAKHLNAHHPDKLELEKSLNAQKQDAQKQRCKKGRKKTTNSSSTDSPSESNQNQQSQDKMNLIIEDGMTEEPCPSSGIGTNPEYPDAVKIEPGTPLGMEVRVGDSKDTNAAPKDGLSTKIEVDEETEPKRDDITRASSSSEVNVDGLSISDPNGQRIRKEGGRPYRRRIPELPNVEVALRGIVHHEAEVGQLQGNSDDSRIQTQKPENSFKTRKPRSHYSKVVARSKQQRTVCNKKGSSNFTKISNSVVQIHLKPIDQDSYPKSSPGPSEEHNIPTHIQKKDFVAAVDNVVRKSARVVAKKKLVVDSVDVDSNDGEMLAVYEFDCSTCDESFDVESDLRKHVRRHHPDEMKKSHVCPNCGSSYTMQTSLRRHQAQAKDPSCKIRIKKKKMKKPHVCPNCGSSYTMQSSLRRHQLQAKDPSCHIGIKKGLKHGRKWTD